MASIARAARSRERAQAAVSAPGLSNDTAENSNSDDIGNNEESLRGGGHRRRRGDSEAWGRRRRHLVVVPRREPGAGYGLGARGGAISDTGVARFRGFAGVHGGGIGVGNEVRTPSEVMRLRKGGGTYSGSTW